MPNSPRANAPTPASTRLNYKFPSVALREACEKRAAEKGITLTEWMGRALTAAVTKGGRVRVTTTHIEEV